MIDFITSLGVNLWAHFCAHPVLIIADLVLVVLLFIIIKVFFGFVEAILSIWG